MAKDKRSFLLYTDVLHTVQQLNNEQAGKLFKHILMYVNDMDPEADFITGLAFEPIKQQLKRDLKKYENICNRNKINGEYGGRPTKEPKKPSGLFGNPNKPKKADNDNDNDNDNSIPLRTRRKITADGIIFVPDTDFAEPDDITS
jgi:hypothetical protein